MAILADPTSAHSLPVPVPVFVIGVDTHTDTHDAVLVDALGAVVAQTRVETTPAGLARLQSWAQAQIPAGQRVLWAVEGSRSHGHGLTRHLRAGGQRVVEAPKPVATRRRRGGKSDVLDAVHAAQAVLAVELATSTGTSTGTSTSTSTGTSTGTGTGTGINADRHAQPRADGIREALRMLLVTHRHDTDMRTATVNLFKSLILGAGDLRETLRRLSTVRQVRTVLALPDPDTGNHIDMETRTRIQVLRRAAATILNLDKAINATEKQLRTLVKQCCPALLDQPGVGPIVAATLLTTWSHHGRIHSEAAFAALAGISPIPASSGRHQRHRLNRGGDRNLNRALHTVVTTRRRMNHTPTSDYIARRTTEGRSPKEILRCLKRYAIRQLYRLLQANTLTT